MSRLTFEAYICDPGPDYPFLITAKRYTAPSCVSDDPDALTLVLAHGTGYHKEHWEPTLEHILEHAAHDVRVKIRDAWAIDCPNHGDAAVLNERTLLWGYDNCAFFASAVWCVYSSPPLFLVSWEEYARSVHLFLSGLYPGVDVDFTKRNLVGIGHSMGCIALYASRISPVPLLQPLHTESSPTPTSRRSPSPPSSSQSQWVSPKTRCRPLSPSSSRTARRSGATCFPHAKRHSPGSSPAPGSRCGIPVCSGYSSYALLFAKAHAWGLTDRVVCRSMGCGSSRRRSTLTRRAA